MNGFDYFAGSLVKFGGTPYATVYTEGQNSDNYTPVYSLVTATGLGDPLTGNSVESASAFSRRTRPARFTARWRAISTASTHRRRPRRRLTTLSSPRAVRRPRILVLQRTANQLPVDWPVLAGKLPGADTLAGQIDAYRFISTTLVRGKYLKEVRGNSGRPPLLFSAARPIRSSTITPRSARPAAADVGADDAGARDALLHEHRGRQQRSRLPATPTSARGTAMSSSR